MPVVDYSTTPASNTTISGINIAEGWSPASVNNALRQLMADVRAFYDLVEAGSAWQPEDAALTSIAGLTTAANKMPYTTAADTYATTDLTAFARTILAAVDAVAMRALLGSITVPVADLSARGYAKFTLASFGTIIVQWGSDTSGDNAWSGALNFPTPFASSCFAIVASSSITAASATEGDSINAAPLSASQFRIGCNDGARVAYWIAVGV